jgi:hypothetical protein
MGSWQARIEPIFLQRLPTCLLKARADRSEHVSSRIPRLKAVRDLIFALENALFDFGRAGNHYEKSGQPVGNMP